MMRMERASRALAAGAGLLLLFLVSTCGTRADPTSPQYYSPLRDAEYVSTGATIIVRCGPVLTEQDVTRIRFTVQGSASGAHQGRTILADDHRTVIFEPATPFTPGEQVQVTVDVSSLRLDAKTTYDGLSYAFAVAVGQQDGSVLTHTPQPPDHGPRSAFPTFLTLPQDIPHYTVAKTSADTGEGYIFVAPFYWTKTTTGSYLLILDQQGQIVYYRSVADQLAAFDFKEQQNGLLSYFSQSDSTFYLLDSRYQVVDTYEAGNGYFADLHDFQLLPDGNALLMTYDAVTIDMSKVVLGGQKDASVTGLIIQELDPSKNVIFEWRSWDHFSFADSTSILTDQEVDLVHGNALALANDGNLLLSSRNLSEITKIDLDTGDVIWRLGGKANQFQFVNGQPFAYQHDVRQLANGNITVFDNQGTPGDPAPSRAIEYRIDEMDKTATEVWSFEHTPPVFGTFMGNTQRLSSSNTFISWGAPSTAAGYEWVSMTEVTPDNQTLFELTFDEPYVSYRAFRLPWNGAPDSQPALAYQAVGGQVLLGYSWNGATDVASYQVLAGRSAQALGLLQVEAKTGFETQSRLGGLPEGTCYFQVAALDHSGNEMARSRIISTDPVRCPPQP